MKGKILTVLISLFLLQFAMSCFIFDCDMEGKIYEVEYNSFILSAWDTERLIELPVEDTVSKNAFRLEVFINREVVLLSSLNQKYKSLGFNSAYACSEPQILVRYNDPIVSAEILVQNTETLITTDVTANFESIRYGEQEFSTLDGLLKYYGESWSIFYENEESFKVQLTNIDTIPDTAIFTVNIYLESGISLNQQTHQINFRQ